MFQCGLSSLHGALFAFIGNLFGVYGGALPNFKHRRGVPVTCPGGAVVTYRLGNMGSAGGAVVFLMVWVLSPGLALEERMYAPCPNRLVLSREFGWLKGWDSGTLTRGRLGWAARRDP